MSLVSAVDYDAVLFGLTDCRRIQTYLYNIDDRCRSLVPKTFRSIKAYKNFTVFSESDCQGRKFDIGTQECQNLPFSPKSYKKS